MIVTPKVRGFICTSAHPDGCKGNVKDQFAYAADNSKCDFKRVLVIGCSTGYGLSGMIAAVANGSKTVGLCYERASENNRAASAGWYNCAAVKEVADIKGQYCRLINGDAFGNDIKLKTVDLIKRDLKQVDFVLYSLASPKRTVDGGETFRSVIKPIGKDYTTKTLDLKDYTVTEATLIPASEQEIADTVKVMGGEDWFDWIKLLMSEGVLSKDAVTIALSYRGSKLTDPIYYDGTIGQAKKNLNEFCDKINASLRVKACVSVNKAVVTQASAAIPAVPLYMAILIKIMKENGTHEDTIQQMCRMYDKLKDANSTICLDEYELSDDVQSSVKRAWDKIDNGNLNELASINEYKDAFYKLFGFNRDDVNYDADTDIEYGKDIM